MSENTLIQYPNSAAEMSIPANTTITPVDRRINLKLIFVSVSIPENGTMTVYNNNVKTMFFADETVNLIFPDGVLYEDLVIVLSNTGTDAARFNYRMIFE